MPRVALLALHALAGIAGTALTAAALVPLAPHQLVSTVGRPRGDEQRFALGMNDQGGRTIKKLILQGRRLAASGAALVGDVALTTVAGNAVQASGKVS
jgi:hypothetical protein